ncbi:MAG TPA: DUF885 domain-containing protein [Gammaproteobacteria bacterium]
MREYKKITTVTILVLGGLTGFGDRTAAQQNADARFEALAGRFIEEMPGYWPVYATQLGDHRFDTAIDRVNAGAREARIELYARYLDDLGDIDVTSLSRANQVDAELLRHELESGLWSFEVLQEWAWNPLDYTDIAGSAIYGLVARDFAPIDERMLRVDARLSELPRFFSEARESLDPVRVPLIHAETAVQQHAGLMSLVDELIIPMMDGLPQGIRDRLMVSISVAREAARRHGEWLENVLLPNAAGEFRLGSELYEQKLEFTLNSTLSPRTVARRAQREFDAVRDEMYEVARAVYEEKYPFADLPDRPSDDLQQVVIRAALEEAYQRLPDRDAIVEVAAESLDRTRAFVVERDLVTVPNDPIEIVVMPEFQRGVYVAYCDSPGPLEAGAETFYAVAPLPDDWTPEQDRSFLREYNLLSIEDLTIHEAMPGHYLQLSHSNRYPSVLRAVLSSGPFIEGWAVYAERLMIEQGYLENEPLMRLINLKWYLRTVTNAIIDQAIHAGDMTREEALDLMIEGAFQEEREAAGKWTRAQLTSAQLSTYFVGYLEHADLRREVESAAGANFSLKAYHDEVLSYGSPPGRYIRALMLDEPIL